MIEIKTNIPGIDIGPIIFIRITEDQADKLVKSGVKPCKITNKIPEPQSGMNLEFKCTLIVEEQAFQVFDAKNSEDKTIFMRIPMHEVLEPLVQEIRRQTITPYHNNSTI